MVPNKLGNPPAWDPLFLTKALGLCITNKPRKIWPKVRSPSPLKTVNFYDAFLIFVRRVQIGHQRLVFTSRLTLGAMFATCLPSFSSTRPTLGYFMTVSGPIITIPHAGTQANLLLSFVFKISHPGPRRCYRVRLRESNHTLAIFFLLTGRC